ncbi:OmpA family protein [Parendozoicomonas haliclonae]|uniref:Peptidoglycan-binding protein ArfA n=1 Tax=Parendozoicomonas haliclonae TaxID=1960125 RepID=A0A1X7AQF9_9GAMM|nr:OmpA family protein [Parendozoicomonas haliclonae]SMA50319.1 Peptidoglycan-binding protein ArfA [Parendozoicomonas haliclonae]
MMKQLPRVSAVVLILTLLAGCASSGFSTSSSHSKADDWTLCAAKGGFALGIPAAVFDLATGGVAFIAGALFGGVACAAADNGMAVVNFPLDSAALSKQQKEFLNTVASELKPGMTVEVTGHTCDLGSQGYNQSLSLKRAAAVKAYLMKKGVKKHQIKTFAKGETMPAVDNTTEENRSKNRRAEIRIVDKK